MWLISASRHIFRGSQWYMLRRCCHSQINSNNNKASDDVRVRFAPSPTGNLHLGGLRTALYNYLFARANNGRFIVRIEDTDRTRLVPGATNKIFKDLEWAGITPDESVLHGGNYGPYLQSERLNLYNSEVQTLLDNRSAYRCFCTERRLDLLRKQAIKLQQKLGYDNRCRHLTDEQIATKLTNKEPYCIRFKLSDDITGLDDLIYGRVEYDVAKNESDPIIMKTDGYPTYHFASVVDDHFMEITHVLRGVEWQISTQKHLQLYRAFGWTPPKFAHMPLLVNSEGRKLSKRQKDINVDYYRTKNVFSQALVNFMVHTGGGFAIDESAGVKSRSMDELGKLFDISLVHSHSGRLAFDYLDNYNRLEIIRQVSDPERCEELVDRVQSLIQKEYPEDKFNVKTDKAHIRQVLHWATNQRVHSLDQLVVGDLSFLWVLPNVNTNVYNIPDAIFDALSHQLLSDIEFKNDQLLVLLKEFAAKNNLNFAHFMQTLRARLSGTPKGPKVGEMMEILGPKSTVERIKKVTAGVDGDGHQQRMEKIDTA